MDFKSSKRFRRIYLACIIASTVGCVAPQAPVPTVWQKLGIPQTGARVRDSLINRRGNFPGLEKKPPVLKIADPANLAPEMPDMLKAAAEIKQQEDLKQQKLKALKYLAEINCGCYDKDGKVEAAFLEALEDCDPDIRTAAIEGLDKAAGECSKCKTGCETTCCTKKIVDKLQDIATGMKDGCYKEPVPEIRKAAKALFCKCPPPPGEPIVPEELIAPEPDAPQKLEELKEGKKDAEAVDAKEASFNLKDDEEFDSYGPYDASPVLVETVNHETGGESSLSLSDASPSDVPKATTVAKPLSETKVAKPQSGRITNPDQLVTSKVVAYRKSLGELLVQMPDSYELNTGWSAIIVDSEGNNCLATINDVGGRRVLFAIEQPDNVRITDGSQVRIGLIAQ